MNESLSINVDADSTSKRLKLEFKVNKDFDMFFVILNDKEICYSNIKDLLALFKRGLEIWKPEE